MEDVLLSLRFDHILTDPPISISKRMRGISGQHANG
jgi:hypothetical protein